MFVPLFAADLPFNLLLSKPSLTGGLTVEIKPDFFFGISGNFTQDVELNVFVSDGSVKHPHFIVTAVASSGVDHLQFQKAAFYLVDSL
jgi:hypothetical protein